jgi:hypothetical protein
MDDARRLVTVAMAPADDEEPLLSDFPFTAVCSLSFVLPIAASFLLLTCALRVPRPFKAVTLSCTETEPSTVESELEIPGGVAVFASLAVELSSAVSAPLELFVRVWHSAVVQANSSAAHRTIPVFRADFISAPKIRASVTFRPGPVPSRARAHWFVSDDTALRFHSRAKLILSVLAIPPAVAACRITRDRASLFLLLLCQFPFDLLLPGTLPASLAGDLPLAVLPLHAVAILISLFASDGTALAAFCLFAVAVLARAVHFRVNRPAVALFPASVRGAWHPPWLYGAAVGWAAGFAAYAAAALLRQRPRKTERFWYFAAIDFFALIGTIAYLAVAFFELPWANSAAHGILPAVGRFLYGCLALHGCRAAETGRPYAAPGARPDTALGVELELAQLLPLGAD